jgi:hypothetical protein
MSERKTYQYVLTADECRLFNHLRELEDEFKEEYPLIYDGSDSRLWARSVPGKHSVQLIKTVDTRSSHWFWRSKAVASAVLS